MPREYRLRILHISDLHERVALEFMTGQRRAKVRLSRAGRRRVLDESNFLDVIKDESRQSGRIDLVCFTGDIADWGLTEEYREASERINKILEVCEVPRHRLFPIPGNHDVRRSAEKDAWSEMRKLAAANAEGLSNWMAGMDPPYGAQPPWRDSIASRTEQFWKWVESDLNRPSLLPVRSPHGHLGYQAKVHNRAACILVTLRHFAGVLMNYIGRGHVPNDRIQPVATRLAQLSYSAEALTLLKRLLSPIDNHSAMKTVAPMTARAGTAQSPDALFHLLRFKVVG